MSEAKWTLVSDQMWTGPIPGSEWIFETLLVAECTECGARVCEAAGGEIRYRPGAGMTPGVGPRCGEHPA